MDKGKLRLEAQVHELEGESRQWSKENIKLTNVSKKLSFKAKELKNLAKELRIDIIGKETRLDHLQKMNDQLSRTKEAVIKEFKASNALSKLLDENYEVGFEDFCQDAKEVFP